jgi:hypothetical protein
LTRVNPVHLWNADSACAFQAQSESVAIEQLACVEQAELRAIPCGVVFVE